MVQGVVRSNSVFGQDTVTCPECGIDYVPSRYINIRGAKVPICPECGTINVPTVQSELEGEECDFDEYEANQES